MKREERDWNPTGARVYLWLSCEGWVRFGPFEWLASDEAGNLRDERGEVVASRLPDGRWTVTKERYASWRFWDVIITAAPEHPKPNCGAAPRRRSSS